MDNNFSTQVKEIIAYSREEALRLGNDFIGAEHLMLGLIRDQENTAIKVLKQLNVNLGELRKEIELAVKDKSGKNVTNINSLPLTKQAEKVIRVTVLEAKALKSPMVETEHLLLSILKNKENIATQILNQFDVDYDLFRNEVGISFKDHIFVSPFEMSQLKTTALLDFMDTKQNFEVHFTEIENYTLVWLWEIH